VFKLLLSVDNDSFGSDADADLFEWLFPIDSDGDGPICLIGYSLLTVALKPIGSSQFLVCYIWLIVGCVLAIIVHFTSRPDQPPVYHWVSYPHVTRNILLAQKTHWGEGKITPQTYLSLPMR
jgi:hypothetical protein